MHPALHVEPRAVGDLQVLLVEHAELEDRDRGSLHRYDGAARVTQAVGGASGDVVVAYQRVQARIRTAVHRFLRGPAVRQYCHGRDGKSRHDRPCQRVELGLRDEPVGHLGRELLHDVVGRGLSRVRRAGISVVVVGRSGRRGHAADGEDAEDREQQQDEQRRFEREALPVVQHLGSRHPFLLGIARRARAFRLLTGKTGASYVCPRFGYECQRLSCCKPKPNRQFVQHCACSVCNLLRPAAQRGRFHDMNMTRNFHRIIAIGIPKHPAHFGGLAPSVFATTDA